MAESEAYLKRQDVLSLSGQALKELVQASLAKEAIVRFRAGGHSMVPFICDGDVIEITPLRSKPRPGQVVAYIQPERGNLVVHRLVGFQHDRAILQGDAAFSLPEPAALESILGRVQRVIRQGKPVWAGLGPEGALIGLLSRWGWLGPVVSLALRSRNIFHRKALQ